MTATPKCESDKCVSNYEEPAAYFIDSDGKRLWLCAACWIRREHEIIRERVKRLKEGKDE